MYLIQWSLTLASSASNLAFSSSASSLIKSFFKNVGADSTHSFASLRPRPSNALTSLINLILVAAENSNNSTS